MITICVGSEVSTRYAKVVEKAGTTKRTRRSAIQIRLFGKGNSKGRFREAMTLQSTNMDIKPLMSATVLRVTAIKGMSFFKNMYQGKECYHIYVLCEFEVASTIELEEYDDTAGNGAEKAYLDFGRVTADDLMGD